MKTTKRISIALALVLMLTSVSVYADDVYVNKGGYYHLTGVTMWDKGYQQIYVFHQYANSSSSISYQVLDSGYNVLEGKNWSGDKVNVSHYYNLKWVAGNNRKVYWIVPSGSTMSSVRTNAQFYGEGY